MTARAGAMHLRNVHPVPQHPAAARPFRGLRVHGAGQRWATPCWVAAYRSALGGVRVLHAIPADCPETLVRALTGDKDTPTGQKAPCGAPLDLDALWWRAHPDMLIDPAWRRCTRCLDTTGA